MAPTDPSPRLTPRSRTVLRRRLCAWFARERRDLPWRRTNDPYSIWISEAMLQQTRVEAVREHYARFLERLPTLADLAAASEDEVVALWSGLGYYRRARALREAALEIVRTHAGRFPRTRAELLELPGIGPYTAGAVLSIAFQLSEPLVDGNVMRVFARLFGIDAEPGSGATRRSWALAHELVPEATDCQDVPEVSPGNWNQALMELGALVCTPLAPRCDRCPLAARCVARATKRTAELPRRPVRREPVEVDLEVLLVRRRDTVLVLRRPPTGRMAGLWELPTRELTATGLWPTEHALPLEAEGPELGRLSHAITHHRVRASLRTARLVGSTEASSPTRVRWASTAELGELGATGLTRKALARTGEPLVPVAAPPADRGPRLG